jgi:integrase
MPKLVTISETKIRYAKSKEKEYSLAAGDGLYLRVSPTGVKSWLFNYFKPHINTRSNISIGKYPAIGLADAKKVRDEYRALLAKGIDPKTNREQEGDEQRDRLSNTFEAVFREWLEARKAKKKNFSESYIKRMLPTIELHVIPGIGHIPVSDLTPHTVIKTLSPLETKGNFETLRKVCGWINEVMDYAMNMGMIESNRLSAIRKHFSAPTTTNRPTIKPEGLPKLLSDLEQASMTLQTRCAIEWLLHTLVRPVEGASTRWDEIDLEKALWTIPAKKMKMRRDHVIPLTPQALNILEIMRPISGSREYVFPSHIRPREHMNPETANNALKRMGYGGKLVAHGLRALGSTTLNEKGFDPELIEVSLAHIDGSVRGDYNRAAYIDRRREIMEWWSSHIEGAANGRAPEEE